MSRKLAVALFAVLFAVVTAWADPGGEGGCVNLPGGRGSGRPGMSSYNGPFHATVVETSGVTLRLPVEFFDAAALVRGVDLPFAFWMSVDHDTLRVPAQFLAILRSVGGSAFTIDFLTKTGERLPVSFKLDAGQQVQIFVE